MPLILWVVFLLHMLSWSWCFINCSFPVKKKTRELLFLMLFYVWVWLLHLRLYWYSPFLFFWFPFLIAKRISFREILNGFIGYSVPFIYYFTVVYLTGSEHKLNFTHQNWEVQIKDFWFVTMALSVLLIFAFIAMIQKGRTAKIQTNKRLRTLTLLVFIFLFCALFQILSFQQLDILSFVLIPLSILLIFCFLSYSYGLVITILFYVLFAYSVMKFFVFLPIEHV